MWRLLLALLLSFPAAAQEAAVDVQALVNAAVQNRQPVLKLPAGTFVLPKLDVKGAQGLTIDGTGTTLVFSDHKANGIGVSQCKGITLRGLTVDYNPLPFTQGTVTAKAPDQSWIEFDVHDGYPDLASEYLVPQCHIFHATRVEWKREAPDLYARKTLAVTPRHGRLEARAGTPYFASVELGDRVVLNKRSGNAIKFWDSEDITVEGVTILASPGCALICRYVKGTNRFQYDIRRGPTPPGAIQPRLMSSDADGFNYAYSPKGPVLENCNFSFMGDDSVNLHGPTLLVVATPSPTEILAAHPYGPEPVHKVIQPGHTARLLRLPTYAVAGQVPIASCTCEPQSTPPYLEAIGKFWPRNEPGRGCVYRFLLREPLAARVGDCLDVPEINAPDFVIRNNYFHDHRARGIILGASRGLVEGNAIERTKQIAIKIDPGYVYWREAGWVSDVMVRNNRIVDVAASPDNGGRNKFALGAISVAGQTEDPRNPEPLFAGNAHIAIESNLVDGCSVAGIWVRCARDVTIRGNTLRHVMYGAKPDTGADQGVDLRDPVDVRGVEGTVLEGNQVAEVGMPPGL